MRSIEVWVDLRAKKKVILELPQKLPVGDNEKMIVEKEISKLEQWVSRGNLYALERALREYRTFRLPLPMWLFRALNRLVLKEMFLDKRQAQMRHRLSVDKVRWATVRHLRVTRSLTWDRAFAATSDELKGSLFSGGEETMRASYKRYQRDFVINNPEKVMKADEINATAAAIYLRYKDIFPSRVEG